MALSQSLADLCFVQEQGEHYFDGQKEIEYTSAGYFSKQREFIFGDVFVTVVSVVSYELPGVKFHYVIHEPGGGGGGALGYFLGGYVPPGTQNWHPVLKKISPKIDTPF